MDLEIGAGEPKSRGRDDLDGGQQVPGSLPMPMPMPMPIPVPVTYPYLAQSSRMPPLRHHDDNLPWVPVSESRTAPARFIDQSLAQDDSSWPGDVAYVPSSYEEPDPHLGGGGFVGATQASSYGSWAHPMPIEPSQQQQQQQFIGLDSSGLRWDESPRPTTRAPGRQSRQQPRELPRQRSRYRHVGGQMQMEPAHSSRRHRHRPRHRHHHDQQQRENVQGRGPHHEPQRRAPTAQQYPYTQGGQTDPHNDELELESEPEFGSEPQSELDEPEIFQRWRNSPPETEAASLPAIANALRQNSHQLRPRMSAGSLSLQSGRARSRGGSSATGTSRSSGLTQSSGSAISAASVSTTGTGSGLGLTTRRQRGRAAHQHHSRGRTGVAAKDNSIRLDRRIFSCTFCCDTFRNKHDWMRHEKSLHLNLEGWRCTPFGGTVASPETGRKHCAYCNALDPTPEHLEVHRHGRCQETGGLVQTNTFRRKDHLMQHLKHVHDLQTMPLLDGWRVEGPVVTSRCGFCDIRLQTWQERANHLAAHFRQGCTLKDWKGDHEFEPHIENLVTLAIPPYLLEFESQSYSPFSATDPTAKEHWRQIRQSIEQGIVDMDMMGGKEPPGAVAVAENSPEASPESLRDSLQPPSFSEAEVMSMPFPQMLAFHLGRFAQQQIRLGVVPTDHMFQDEARRLQFGTDDPWDRTIADNPDWMFTFRRRHMGGLDG